MSFAASTSTAIAPNSYVAVAASGSHVGEFVERARDAGAPASYICTEAVANCSPVPNSYISGADRCRPTPQEPVMVLRRVQLDKTRTNARRINLIAIR